MASFPTSVKTFTTLVDNADSVLASHQNERGAEITAIETWILDGAAKGTTTIVDLLKKILRPGEMMNGRISVTVASNDLVLAIKTAAGADPSSTDPVYVNINGTVRTITAATSCTLADATNWFGSGGAELATREVDYFAYAIWDSNSSVVAVAPARIPFGRVVSDFSATSTNEKYIGNYANYTTTDDVCVIGRFAATLSAGAGYTWTVPSFTGVNLIQSAIFETRWLLWTPTITGYSATPTDTVYRYMVRGTDVSYILREATAGTSNATTKTYSMPFTAKTITNMVWYGFIGLPVDNGAVGAAGYTTISSGTSTLNARLSMSTAWTASGSAQIANGFGEYGI